MGEVAGGGRDDLELGSVDTQPSLLTVSTEPILAASVVNEAVQ